MNEQIPGFGSGDIGAGAAVQRRAIISSGRFVPARQQPDLTTVVASTTTVPHPTDPRVINLQKLAYALLFRQDGFYDIATYGIVYAVVEGAGWNDRPPAPCGNSVWSRPGHAGTPDTFGAELQMNEQIPGLGGSIVPVSRQQPQPNWRPHRGQLPAGLQSLGLGAVPVYSHADRAWYAKPSSDVLRFGFGAPLDDAANAVLAYFASNPCTSAAVSAVSDFQTQFNASGGSPTLSVDGKYGIHSQAALQGYLTAAGAGTAPAACYDASGNYIGPGAGGGGGGGGGGTVVVVPPSSTSAVDYKSYLIGAGVVSAGVVGYALYKSSKKRHRRYVY